MENVTIEKQVKEFKLIEGSFSPDDAKEILMHMFKEKINFHKIRDFSHQERFGEHNHSSLKRIEELTESKAEILELLQEAQLLNKTLKIKSNISIVAAD
ncbi:MAG: hypothetical protein RIM99_13340 [Cyclobacteriaceae bacterium]